MKTLLILSIAILGMSMSCKKKNRCSRDYILEHPISIYPIQDNYNIGDTIWIEMNFPDVFTLWYPNKQTMNEYHTTTAKLVNFDFHRNFLSVFKLSDNTTNVTGQQKGLWTSSCDEILVEGNILQILPDGPEYVLNYENNSYSLKIGIILKQQGYYLINPIFLHKYPVNNSGNEQDITPECEKEMISKINFPINRQSDGTHLTNYHIFEEYMNPALENDLERIKNRCFTIKVN